MCGARSLSHSVDARQWNLSLSAIHDQPALLGPRRARAVQPGFHRVRTYLEQRCRGVDARVPDERWEVHMISTLQNVDLKRKYLVRATLRYVEPLEKQRPMLRGMDYRRESGVRIRSAREE